MIRSNMQRFGMTGGSVLVVGGAGYIGAHMVKDLLTSGYEVVVLDDLSRGHRDLVTGGTFIQGRLGDPDLLDQLFQEHRIDAVMHFAAYSLLGESMERPLDYYRNNVSQTIELLRAMLRHQVRRFVFSSSGAVYGEPIRIPIEEDQDRAPTNPYGVTMLAVEQALADCDQAYGLKSMSLRYFNAAGADASGLIGERHRPETHLIPSILKVATGERERISIFGTDYPTPDGTCVCDYIHVSDLAQAHLLALEVLLNGGESATYNLGNSRGYSVREVLELSREVTGHPIPAVTAERRPGDHGALVAASEKIKRELAWRPRHDDLETIVKSAWVWHRQEAGRL